MPCGWRCSSTRCIWARAPSCVGSSPSRTSCSGSGRKRRRDVRDQVIERTRRWVMRGPARRRPHGRPGNSQGGGRPVCAVRRGNDRTVDQREMGSVHAAPAVAHLHHRRARNPTLRPAAAAAGAHRDVMLRATGIDTDRYVNEELIRYCAAFLDQGVANWTLPGRDKGFYRAWIELNRNSRPLEHWLRGCRRSCGGSKRRGLRRWNRSTNRSICWACARAGARSTCSKRCWR